MITSQEDFHKFKSRDLIEIECDFCHKLFKRKKHYIQANLKNREKCFCSNICVIKYRNLNKSIEQPCGNCQNMVHRPIYQFNKSKSKNIFCSSSCAAIYNNTHKTKGYRRSKLECWLEIQLKEMYSNLEILFNNKTFINSELDIYIPSLNLAFELNGIFHYEPIYGQDTLNKIKNNDNRKFQACLEKQIELCIIDTSKFLNFKEHKAKPYLKIITDLINLKINQNLLLFDSPDSPPQVVANA